MTSGGKVVVAGAAVGTGWFVVRTGVFFALSKLVAFVAAQEALAASSENERLDEVIDLTDEELATAL